MKALTVPSSKNISPMRFAETEVFVREGCKACMGAGNTIPKELMQFNLRHGKNPSLMASAEFRAYYGYYPEKNRTCFWCNGKGYVEKWIDIKTIIKENGIMQRA